MTTKTIRHTLPAIACSLLLGATTVDAQENARQQRARSQERLLRWAGVGAAPMSAGLTRALTGATGGERDKLTVTNGVVQVKTWRSSGRSESGVQSYLTINRRPTAIPAKNSGIWDVTLDRYGSYSTGGHQSMGAGDDGAPTFKDTNTHRGLKRFANGNTLEVFVNDKGMTVKGHYQVTGPNGKVLVRRGSLETLYSEKDSPRVNRLFGISAAELGRLMTSLGD